MILESPHKSEFPRDGSAGPARGATGTRIRKHLAQAFRCLPLIDNVHRPLILMNAIQHQCSLGQPPKCHRDTVFCLMWDQPRVRIDFSRRLRGYTQDKGALVINACTLGSLSFPIPQVGSETTLLLSHEASVRVRYVCFRNAQKAARMIASGM